MLDNLPFFVRNVHYGRVKRVSASVSIPARVPGKMDRRFIIGVVLIIASVLAFSVLGGFLRGGTRVYTVTTSIAPGETSVKSFSPWNPPSMFRLRKHHWGHPSPDHLSPGSSSCEPTWPIVTTTVGRTPTRWFVSHSP